MSLIKGRPNPVVWAIVQTWPARLVARRGQELGEAEDRFDEVLAVHIEDELGGRVPVAEGV